MTTMQRDPLVADYLRRLEAAAAHLPRDRRAELVGEIEEHVDAALGEAGARDEATVRNVLERLGPPEEIAAAAEPPPAAPRRRRRGALETAALIVLSVSFLVPVIGYLIGASLVLASSAWDDREKLTAVLIPPVVLLAGGLDRDDGRGERRRGRLVRLRTRAAGDRGPPRHPPLRLRGRAVSGLAAAAAYGGVRRRMRSSSSSGSPRPSRLVVST